MAGEYPKTVVTVQVRSYDEEGGEYVLVLPDGETAVLGNRGDDYWALAAIIDRAFPEEEG